MKWIVELFCRLLGHKWQAGKWYTGPWPVLAWQRNIECERCKQSYCESIHSPVKPLDVF